MTILSFCIEVEHVVANLIELGKHYAILSKPVIFGVYFLLTDNIIALVVIRNKCTLVEFVLVSICCCLSCCADVSSEYFTFLVEPEPLFVILLLVCVVRKPCLNPFILLSVSVILVAAVVNIAVVSYEVLFTIAGAEYVCICVTVFVVAIPLAINHHPGSLGNCERCHGSA